MNIASESKKLALQLRANEDSYITGHLDLNETLDETDRLYREVHIKYVDDHSITATEITPDSDLMKLQTGLAKRSAKSYKPDSLVFNSTEFAQKLKQFFNSSTFEATESSKTEEYLWLELGNVAKKLLHTVPSFSFIQGTFDPDPVEVVKKKRKVKEKDKVGDVTKPESMDIKDATGQKDMITEAERVLGILAQLKKKSEDNVICFYEFVTDPTSFPRTVENIFILSLLVKEGCVRIIKDRNGLPCLYQISDKEKKEGNTTSTKQCILSISVEEWKNIVKTFKLKKPLIPPRRKTAKEK